jgi:hypothetical protein
MILEDDIYFHKDFMNLLEKNHTNIIQNNVVYIGLNQKHFTKTQINSISDKGYFHLSTNYFTYGTFAVILDQKSIKLLYDYLIINNFRDDIDIAMNKIFVSKLKNIVLFPPLCLVEVRDSDNMDIRDLDTFLKERYLYKQKHNYLHIKEYQKFVHNNKLNRQISHYDNMFVFIIPSYNNEEWFERNLKSILFQNYTKWRIIYINDMSSDNTMQKVKSFIKTYHLESRIHLIENIERTFQGYARYQAYQLCNDNEICVMLDGDDWLYDEYVLEHLNNLYMKGIQVTYGQFLYWDDILLNKGGTETFPLTVLKEKGYRKYKWISQHLRTMRAKLIKPMDVSLLKDQEGKWIRVCTDLIEMFYVLERCNGRHCNANKILMVYNQKNSKRYSFSYYNSAENEYKKRIENYVRNLYIYRK